MRTHYTYILLMLLTLVSCQRKGAIVADGVEITFASTMQEEIKQTKAGGSSEPLCQDFRVWGYKKEGTRIQAVFEGYKVSYMPGTAGTSEDNTHDYLYVGNTSLKGIDQTIKFWDYSANEYTYWGATGGTFNDDGTDLTITDLKQSLTEPNVDDKLFSARLHRSPVSSDVVRLEFKHPYTKVRLLFFTNAPMSDEKVDGEYFDNIQIKNITFGPEAPTEIITEGTLTVHYEKAGEGPESYSTVGTSSTATWSYHDITLDYEHGTASNHAEIGVPNEPNGVEYYYAVPNNYATPFVLSAMIDGETKTAVVPQNFMDWRPNTVYTYLFKISGGNRIEIYDVQVDPWTFGGSQEDEWKNW